MKSLTLTNKKSSGEIISSYEYTTDNRGLRTKVVDNTGKTTDYIYDDAGKLIKEVVTENGKVTLISSYSYDAVGNRLTKTENNKMTGIISRNGEVIFQNEYVSGGGVGGYRDGLLHHTERKFLNDADMIVVSGDILYMEGFLNPCKPGTNLQLERLYKKITYQPHIMLLNHNKFSSGKLLMIQS